MRAGARLRLIVVPGGPDADAVAAFLQARGLSAAAVEPSVTDLFVSFMNKERKGRVREQLQAVAKPRL